MTVKDSAYLILNPTEFLNFDSDGELNLLEFCAPGPGVIKIKAQVTLFASNALQDDMDMSTPEMFLEKDGVTKVSAYAYDGDMDDADMDDVVGLQWTGRISEDTTFSIKFLSMGDLTMAIRPATAWVIYELYPDTYPLLNNFPADTCPTVAV